jgi:hypothetical protein
MRRRIHANHMRRRIHACHKRRGNVCAPPSPSPTFLMKRRIHAII